MKRKLVKSGNGIIMNIPPAFLELIGAKRGDYVEVTFNPRTKKIEISKSN